MFIVGTPSLCYRYDGDGVCEKDEEGSSLRDCGFYTPPGYEDQWPVSVSGNPQHQKMPECPEEVLIGAPSRFQVTFQIYKRLRNEMIFSVRQHYQ